MIEEYYKMAGKQKKEEATTTKEAATLRKEFAAQSKELGFKDAQKSWNKVQNADKNAAGDLTVIYSYIKALDPTSVVREGEINLTKAAESVPSNIIRAYQKAKEGRVMSPELRAKMVREVGLMYNERAKQQQELSAFYSGLATDSQLDPNDVIGGIGEIKLANIPEVPAEQTQGIQGPLGAILGLGKQAADFLIPETQKAFLQGPQQIQQNAMQRPNAQGNLPQAVINAGQQTVDLAKTAVPAGLEAGLLGGGGGLLKAGGKLGGGVLSKILPKKGALDEAAKTVGNLNTKPIIEAGEKYVKNNPLAKELWETIKPTIGTKTPAPDVLSKMFDVWKGAYSKTGDVRTTAEAQLYNKLYGAGRKVIEEQAPEVSKHISNLKFLHELPKMAQKGSWLGLKTAGILKLLGL